MEGARNCHLYVARYETKGCGFWFEFHAGDRSLHPVSPVVYVHFFINHNHNNVVVLHWYW